MIEIFVYLSLYKEILYGTSKIHVFFLSRSGFLFFVFTRPSSFHLVFVQHCLRKFSKANQIYKCVKFLESYFSGCMATPLSNIWNKKEKVICICRIIYFSWYLAFIRPIFCTLELVLSHIKITCIFIYLFIHLFIYLFILFIYFLPLNIVLSDEILNVKLFLSLWWFWIWNWKTSYTISGHNPLTSL